MHHDHFVLVILLVSFVNGFNRSDVFVFPSFNLRDDNIDAFLFGKGLRNDIRHFLIPSFDKDCFDVSFALWEFGQG